MDYTGAFNAYQAKIAALTEEIKALEASTAAVNAQIKTRKKELNKLEGALRAVAPEMFPAKTRGRKAAATATEGDAAAQ